MRDFVADVIGAALPDPIRRAGEFSWSAARHFLFTRCRRAYFIRYYLAQGGWNSHADTLSRTAYFEKHIPSFSVWAESALERAVRNSLRNLPARMDKTRRARIFMQMLIRELGYESGALKNSLEEHSWESDPKLPAIRETLEGIASFRTPVQVAEKCAAVFTNVCRVLSSSTFPSLMASLVPMNFRMAGDFLPLPWHGFTLWLPAHLLYVEKDCAHMIRFHCERSGGCKDENFFARLRIESWLLEQWIHARHPSFSFNCRTMVFSEESVELFHTLPALPGMVDFIDGSSSAMLAMIHADGTVNANDFPESEDKDFCGECPFRITCRRMKSRVGEPVAEKH